MIIRAKSTAMLANRLLATFAPRFPTLLRFACSQLKIDILASNYHRLGPAKFRRSRAVERLLMGQLSTIDTLAGKLDPLRSQALSTDGTGEQVDAYLGVYQQLREAVSSCQINNEWVYNVISWYNMTPFYRVLFQRLLNAHPEEVGHLVNALHAMRAHPRPPLQDLLKQPFLDGFYKRLDVGIEVSLLQKLEEVLEAPLAFMKRKYYEKYLQKNLEGMLKSLNAGNAEQVSELVWLFETAINAMCDDEVLIAKMEKTILTMRVPLTQRDLQRLIAAYSRKGKISLPIYHQYLKPYILKHKMGDFNDVVQAMKFAICSESQDNELLQSILARLEEMLSTSCLTPQMAETLHFYAHYLRIKGVRVFFKKNVEKQLQQKCRDASKDYPNYISPLVNEKERKSATKGLFSYASECTSSPKTKTKPTPLTPASLTPLTPEEVGEFQLTFGYRLGSLDLKSAAIYKEARFCCINMGYCIHSRGSGGSSQIIDLEEDCGSYVFSSGRLAREVEVRDELLAHYGVKVNHFNLMRFKGKGRMSEEEYLINRRVASTLY